MPKSLFSLFQVIFFITTLHIIRCEIFTALADLELLTETESNLTRILENYIRAEEEKLYKLKRYASIYRAHNNKAAQNVKLYVANPINAYTLVKRLTTNWREVENLIRSDLSPDYVANITYIKETMKFPTDEDLNGAAVALTRLQDTYLLDTSSLARGELNGVKYSSELSAADCFELGRQTYNNGDYFHAKLWMREADSRLNREANETVDRSDILDYWAFATYKQGNTPLALDLTNKLLEILPTHSRALRNKIYYEEELQKSEFQKKKGDDGPNSNIVEEDGIKSSKDSSGNQLYKQLCRGEVSLQVEKASKLKCRYLSKNHPFLLLAPFKVEEAHHKPDIFIFHDVLADSEIAKIKYLAQPRFMRATVQSGDKGKTDIAQYRISKSAWLKNYEHRHIADVTQRVTDMTGLNMETTEDLQVVNYGIGGHYEPHYDFFRMSDVEQGGATVFPNIQVALWPRKGAAAFWYNLHPSGDGDKRTFHAACPVLIGSKWVSNKWIRERGQEFLRSCTIEKPNESDVMMN